MNTNLQKSTLSSLARLGKNVCMYVCMIVLTLGAVKTAEAQVVSELFFTADLRSAAPIVGGTIGNTYNATVTPTLRDVSFTPAREQFFTAFGLATNNYAVQGTRFGGQNNAGTLLVSALPNAPTADITPGNWAAHIGTTAPFPVAMNKIEVTTLAIFGNTTAPSGANTGLYLQVSANADFSAAQNYRLTITANNTHTFTGDWAADSYYRIIVTRNNANTTNSGIIISTIAFFGELPPAAAVEIPTFSETGGIIFTPTLSVEIETTTSTATIFYTLDGATPDENSTEYTTPIILDKTTTIRAIAIDGTDKSAIATATYTFPIDVPNIAAYKVAAGTTTNADVPYRITGDLTFVWRDTNTTRRTAYLVDHTGGIALWDLASPILPATINNGDVITNGIVGTLNVFNGMQQLAAVAQTLTLGTSVTPVQPIVVTMQELNTDYVDYRYQLVGLRGVTFTTFGTYSTASGAARENTIAQNGQTIVCRNNFTPGTINGFTPEASTLYDVSGFAIPFNATRQITPRFHADITLTPIITVITDNPLLLPFSTTEVGSSSSALEIEVSQIGLTGNITVALNDTSTGNVFTMDAVTDWDAADGGTLFVTFNPDVEGTFGATITFNGTGAQSTAQEVVVTLTGTAIEAGTPLLEFESRTPIAFGKVLVGSNKPEETTVIADNLENEIKFHFTSTGIATGTYFTAVKDGDFDEDKGGKINITFAPITAGLQRDTLVITSDVGGTIKTDSLELLGEGVGIIVTGSTVVAATNVTRTRFTASWTAVEYATGYTINIFEGTAATGDPARTIDAGNVLTFNVTGLTVNTDYTYTVTARGDLDQTVASVNSRSFKTLAFPEQGDIIISQIFPGAGSNNATYNRRFVELFNTTNEDIVLDELFVLYAGNTSAALGSASTLSGTIKARSFYLLAGDTVTPANGIQGADLLVERDARLVALLAAASGKVALATVNSQAITTNYHDSENILDLVAYGTGHTNPTPANTISVVEGGALSATLSAKRIFENCEFRWKRNSVAGDFNRVAPNVAPLPRNSSTPALNPIVVATTSLAPENEIDFENVREGEPKTEQFTLTLGCLAGNVTLDFADGNEGFTVYPTSIAQAFFGDTIIRVTFTPSDVDNFADVLQIRGSGITPIDIDVTGAGTPATQPEIIVPEELYFGDVLVNTTSEPMEVRITKKFLEGKAVTWSLDDEVHFDVDDSKLISDSLLIVTFSPKQAELDYNAILTVECVELGLSEEVKLTGRGEITHLYLDSAQIDAGNVALNTNRTIVLRATGSLLQDVVTLSIDGADAAMFSVDSTTLTPLANGNLNRPFRITYAPTALGSHTAELTLNTPGATEKFDLFGNSSNIGLAMWTFGTTGAETQNADFGTPQNMGRPITTTAGSPAGTIEFREGFPADPSRAASTSAWNGGGKYWEVKVVTQGYKNILVSSKQLSSATGPRDFKLQYSIDGIAFADVDGGAIVCGNVQWIASGMLDHLPLPAAANNQDTIWLRWLVSSDTTTRVFSSGTTVESLPAGGTSRIEDILIVGDPTPFIAAYPKSLAFPDSEVGTPAYPRTVTVSGINLEGIISHAITGDDEDAFDVIETAWTPADGGTLSVVFTPTETEEQTATLTLTSLNATPVEITLTGTGLAAGTPNLQLSEESLAFENQYILTESEAKTFNVTAANLTNLDYSLSGDAEYFIVTPGTFSKTPPQGGTLDVAFKPLTAGAKTAWLRITSDERKDSVLLTGTGVVATLTADLAEVDFLFGTVGLTDTIRLRVSGVHLQSDVTLKLEGDAEFAINREVLTNPDDGTMTDSIIIITYTPTDTEEHTAELTITSEDAQPIVLQVRGEGATMPDIIIAAIYSGGGNANATWNTKFVELFNTTDEDINLSGIFLGYENATGTSASRSHSPLSGIIKAQSFFLIACSTGTTGAALPVEADFNLPSLNPAMAQGKFWLTTVNPDVVEVLYHNRPTMIDLVAYGGSSGMTPEGISVTGSNGTSTVVVARIFEDATPRWHKNRVNGDFRNVATSAHTPRNSMVTFATTIFADNTTVDFGRTTIGETPTPKPLVVTGANLTDGITWQLGGDDAAAFDVDPDNLPAIGGTLDITFTPTEARVYNATLTLKSTDAQDVIVDLTGTGYVAGTPFMEVDNRSIAFDQQLTGTESAIQTVVVTAGNLPEIIIGKLTGDEADFETEWADGWNYETGGTINIRFIPQTIGEKRAVLYLTSNEVVYDSVVLTGNTEIPVANIAEFKAATGTVTGTTRYKITGDVTFVFRSGRNFYIEDATGGLLIDNNANIITGTYAEGDVIKGGVIGHLNMFNGLRQLVPALNIEAGIAGTPVEPTVLTMEELLKNFDVYESRLIRLNNVSFAANATFTASNGTVANVGITQGDEEMICRNHFNGFTGHAVETGVAYNIIGFAIPFNADRQIAPRSAADIIKVNGTTIRPRELERNIVLYPNPVVNTLYIQAEQPISRVMVFNLNGQLIVQQHGNINSVDLSALSHGNYVVRIVFDDGSMVSRRIVK